MQQFQKTFTLTATFYFFTVLSFVISTSGYIPGDGETPPELLGDGYLTANQARQKRVRTSFKHHQLRAMKSYFALNHNPDAKDLKQLAQKTGLSKRVLQVLRCSDFEFLVKMMTTINNKSEMYMISLYVPSTQAINMYSSS